ncbi:MAG TPA: histidine phosphatase family protein [Blastocatellia bacterium]|nr:histidine phosphatase family protein [Blastocatellia bacterium]
MAAQDPQYADGDNAESFSGLLERVDQFLQRALRGPDGVSAVFSHGYFIKAVLWRVLDSQIQLSAEAGWIDLGKWSGALGLPNGAILPAKLLTNDDHWLSKVLVTALLPDLLVPDR